MKVFFELEEGAQLPVYASAEAAGMDLHAFEDAELRPMERRLIRTGLRMVLPVGFEAQVRPRSGLALKQGIGMVNAPGTIDSDYRGEIGILLINFSESTVQIRKGDRIAQMVIAPVVRAEIQVVPTVADYATARGEDGFGSTGR